METKISKWVKKLVLSSVVLGALGATACKKVVLRDPETYKNEIYLLEMALEQDTELLKVHLADGSCSCDEHNMWVSDVCAMTALNIVVIDARLKWHVAMMMYLGGISKEHPGAEPEVSPEDVSKLCPGNG